LVSHSSSSKEPEIAHEILAYLEEKPEAQDTVEGIAQWWLLERKIFHQINMVREALANLVKEGLVVERTGLNSNTRYQLNLERREEIRKLLKEKAEG
jgi:hypothetical protein